MYSFVASSLSSAWCGCSYVEASLRIQGLVLASPEMRVPSPPLPLTNDNENWLKEDLAKIFSWAKFWKSLWQGDCKDEFVMVRWKNFVERLILFILLPNNMWASLDGCIPKVAMHGAYLIWHRIMTWWHHQRDARISRGVLHDSSTLNTESLTISMSMKKVLQWTLPLARRECLLSEITRLLKAVSSLKFLHVSY